MRNLIRVFIILYIWVSDLEAQPITYSSGQADIQSQISNLSAAYDSLFDPQFDLVNGRLYHPKGNSINHPYFIENAWRPGKIWYSGRIYDSLMLKYDISSDYVIYLVQKPLNTFPVCLNREEIKDFMINGHRFTYMNQLTGSDADETKPGYYEILYDGKTRLIVRWEKAKEPNRFTLETEYLQETYFFMRMKGHYIYVRNQKGFTDSFAEYKKEIRSYMKKNNVRFSSGDHGPIIKLLEFYDNQDLK